MYSLGITVYVQPDQTQTFVEYSREVVIQSRQEPGCLWYDLLRSEKDPTVFTFYGAYNAEEDFQNHLQAPYVRAWFERIHSLVASGGVVFPSHSNIYPHNPEK